MHENSIMRARRSYCPLRPPEGASFVIRPAAPPMPAMPPAAGRLLDSTPSGSSLQTEPLSAADRHGGHAKDEVWKMPNGLRDAARCSSELPIDSGDGIEHLSCECEEWDEQLWVNAG